MTRGRAGHRPHAGPVLATTKTGRTHTTDLDAATHQMLLDHHDVVERRARAVGACLDREAFVFSHDDDGPPDDPPTTLPAHDLRHFVATMMLSEAVRLAVVSQRLNHRADLHHR